MLVGLVEEHWDHSFPEIDDGDAEMRAAPLEWVGGKLDLTVQMTALDRSGYDVRAASRLPPDSHRSSRSGERSKRRDRAKRRSPTESRRPRKSRPHSRQRRRPGSRRSLRTSTRRSSRSRSSTTLSAERFGDVAPSYSRLRDAIVEVQRTARQQLKRKLELDPDPVDLTAVPAVGLRQRTSGSTAAGSEARSRRSRRRATTRRRGS